jgi:hypothetical protein
MGEMTRYKNYWISSYALLARGWGNEWYARGDVCIVEPNGHTLQVTRFEPTDIFPSKEEAEAHGIKLAKAWVDEQS